MTRMITLSAAVSLLVLAGAGVVAQTGQHQHGRPAAPPSGAPMMMQHGQGHGARSDAGLTESSKAYVEAMDRMHAPMIEAAREPDADVAFVKGMIPHHQGAIDMARIVLRYGKDEQTRKLANDVIREQEREIAEMRDWLKRHGH